MPSIVSLGGGGTRIDRWHTTYYYSYCFVLPDVNILHIYNTMDIKVKVYDCSFILFIVYENGFYYYCDLHYTNEC